MAVIVFGEKPKQTRRVWKRLSNGALQQAIEKRTVVREGRYNWIVGRWHLSHMAGKPKFPFKTFRERELGIRRNYFKNYQ